MRGSCPQDLGCHVPARLTIVYLPLHGLQSSSLLCVILNALLTHPAPMHLRSPRKLMSILWGTRCWIRGSKWKRFRTSHITGIESKPRGREKMEKPTLLPLSTHQPPRDMPICLQNPWRPSGLVHSWLTSPKQNGGCMWFFLFCYVVVTGFGGQCRPQQSDGSLMWILLV